MAVFDDFALATSSARPTILPAPIPMAMLQATALRCRSRRLLVGGEVLALKALFKAS
jgi:hypothetical protein